MSDTYWKFPRDLRSRHDKILAEVRMARELSERKRLEARQGEYIRAVRRLLRLSLDVDGYRVYVPDSVSDIYEQAKALSQCLITCDYVSKVIRKECVLVFIRKNGVPVATAQLLPGDRIGQFYADELDRNDCLPSDDVRTALDRWIENKKRVERSE